MKLFNNLINKKDIFIILIICSIIYNVKSITRDDFYSYQEEDSEILARGNEKFDFLRLETPIHFYSQSYDHIYINSNGILTFSSEFTSFVNLPFPLEYPAIAPFYSNVDTTLTNDTSAIIYFTSHNNELLDRATDLVRNGFQDASDFLALSIIVVTWENVGHYDQKNNETNTFQVAVICSEEETYVQFLYPSNGLNWIQADIGDSGLPDVRAQAGFISEDGRFYTLKGSGTENVKYLSELSNFGTPGVWLYRVGRLGYDDNVDEPDRISRHGERPQPISCADGGRLKCHSAADCEDTRTGFCCKCKTGYYGNGISCIKNDVPLRVSGILTGSIGNESITSQLQSYIVMSDGRTYTAINPINSDIGGKTQFLQVIGSTIGWLFSKPHGDSLNGYQLTGGVFNQTVTIHFIETREIFRLTQNFQGLNVYDQLTVQIELSGDLPDIQKGARLQMNDYIDEYIFTSENTIRSVATHKVYNQEEGSYITFAVDQEITFEKCKFMEEANVEQLHPMREKVSKITLSYEERENALRIGLLSKIGISDETNPCNDGSAVCGENTICVPAEDDNYECQCKNGFTPYGSEDSVVNYCVDIDECSGVNVCSDFADCYNDPGGYTCRCHVGYDGNGFDCSRIDLGEPTYAERTSPSAIEETWTVQTQTYDNPASEDNVNHHQDPENGNDSREYDQSHFDQDSRSRSQQEYENRQDHDSRYNNEYHHEEDSRYEHDKQDQDTRYEQDSHEHVSARNEPDYQEQPRINESTIEEEYNERARQQSEHRSSSAPEDNCRYCSINAECRHGECICHPGYSGDGYECNLYCAQNYIWNNDRCVKISTEEETEVHPFCTKHGCTCASGYKLIQYSYGDICQLVEEDNESYNGDVDEKVPCDVEFNCSPFADCLWNQDYLQHECVCNSDYDGNGYVCVEKELSCITSDICHPKALCTYVEELGKSSCVCEKGYEGDGKYCVLAPECRVNEDCTLNGFCDDGICVCREGFERDISDFCVPTGSCNGVYCASNAICQWDSSQAVVYCLCPEGFEGDGIKSCKSLPTPCNVKNNCGLYASCTPNYREPSKYECVCNPGYTGDGFTCSQEINCAVIPNLCHQHATCIATTAGPQCVCLQGYNGNGSYCEAPKHEHGFLIVSQGVAAIRIPFNEKHGTPISMAQMAIGVDKDCSEGRIYWSDISAKNIMSSKYDGTDKKPFITENIVSPEGIAVDWISRRLYWTDSSKDTIEVASLDNPSLRAVIINRHLVNPRGIAVDPLLNKLFWSDWNRDGPKIEWSNLDGSDRKILVSSPNVQLPNSLAVSQQTGELCFADAGAQKIGCVDSYTGVLRTIIGNLSYPFGLGISNDHYYWTDWTTKKIESVDHYGTRKQGIAAPLFGNHKMYGMTTVIDRCPMYFSQCQLNNGDCPSERICLTVPNASSGRTCKCTNPDNCNEVHFDY